MQTNPNKHNCWYPYEFAQITLYHHDFAKVTSIVSITVDMLKSQRAIVILQNLQSVAFQNHCDTVILHSRFGIVAFTKSRCLTVISTYQP